MSLFLELREKRTFQLIDVCYLDLMVLFFVCDG